MMSQLAHNQLDKAWPAAATAALRVAFGIIWAIGAALTWSPDFAVHYVGYLHNAAQGQPAWLQGWFAMWIGMVTPHALLFTWLTRIVETVIALALLTGFARKTLYIVGALFSLLVWSTAEGFGGPYTVGATNMGTALSYVLIFIALIAIDSRGGYNPYSLDFLIERRWPSWRRVAEWRSDAPVPEPSAQVLPWRFQVAVILGIVLLVIFLVGGLRSTLDVKPASPITAAAAVSPLQLASSEPISEPYDARLPPLVGTGNNVTVDVIASDLAVAIASGVEYQAWTFGDTVPGPTIHVREGQTVTVRFTNQGHMLHSIDFHSAITPPNLHYVDIQPGETIEFSFVASTPGVFLYHCGTPPVLLHIANGMFGAIIVDPAEPLPPASASYVLVQNEWYTQQVAGNLVGPNYTKMLETRPDEVVFNGVAFQYRDVPLPVVAGERVRIYFVNAGPSLWSSFHVIGAMFDKVYPDADAAHALSGVSTYTVGPGAGAVFDLVIPQAGEYPFVDHAMSHAVIGAIGVLAVHDPDSASAPAPTSNITRAAPTSASSAATSSAPAAEPSGPYAFNKDQGSALYSANCAACHQATGAGLAGAFPPLIGNTSVNDADATVQIKAVLFGMQGQEVDGVAYATAMPPFGSVLNDTQIADIINHERVSWGNKGKPVDAKDVAAVRAAGAEQ